MKNDKNAVTDYDSCILVSPAVFPGCVTLTHEYDGRATTIGHYFKDTVLHFPLYLL